MALQIGVLSSGVRTVDRIPARDQARQHPSRPSATIAISDVTRMGNGTSCDQAVA